MLKKKIWGGGCDGDPAIYWIWVSGYGNGHPINKTVLKDSYWWAGENIQSWSFIEIGPRHPLVSERHGQGYKHTYTLARTQNPT